MCQHVEMSVRTQPKQYPSAMCTPHRRAQSCIAKHSGSALQSTRGARISDCRGKGCTPAICFALMTREQSTQSALQTVAFTPNSYMSLDQRFSSLRMCLTRASSSTYCLRRVSYITIRIHEQLRACRTLQYRIFHVRR